MFSWPSATISANRLAPAQKASPSLPMTRPDALALGAVDRLHRHRDDVGVDACSSWCGTRGRARRRRGPGSTRAVALQRAARGADGVERQVARVGSATAVKSPRWPQFPELAGSSARAVEAHALALGGDLLDPAGHGEALVLHRLAVARRRARPRSRTGRAPSRSPTSSRDRCRRRRRRSRPGDRRGVDERLEVTVRASAAARSSPAQRRVAASRRRRRRRGSRRSAATRAFSAAVLPVFGSSVRMSSPTFL